MSEYRNRTSGAVNTQGEIRRSMPNTSLPRVWTADICEFLGIDPVLAAPAPAASGEYKVVSRNGVVQDALGNWVEAYVERDMFADYTRTDVAEDGTDRSYSHQDISKKKHTQPIRMQRPLLPPVLPVTI
jgi:hypothetical protein